MRQKLLYTKNTYILKLILRVVTGGTEPFTVLGNKVLYACVKEHCKVSHILTPSINSTLLLKHCYLNQFFNQINR
jgi:hypothetical protein